MGRVAGDAIRRNQMSDSKSLPPLKYLPTGQSLIPLKLTAFDRLSTETLVQSLLPGQRDCLKARPDGTRIDGHHRTHILRQRGIDVDALPRETILKEGTNAE